MAPKLLWRAKSVAGLCDTQAAGTYWHSPGPLVEAMNRALSPPEYLQEWNLHYNMCSGAVGKDLTLCTECHWAQKPASLRFVVQHPCIDLWSIKCPKVVVPTTWTVCESCAVVTLFPAPKEGPKCAQGVAYPICKMEDTLLIGRPAMVWHFKLPWH